MLFFACPVALSQDDFTFQKFLKGHQNVLPARILQGHRSAGKRSSDVFFLGPVSGTSDRFVFARAESRCSLLNFKESHLSFRV